MENTTGSLVESGNALVSGSNNNNTNTNTNCIEEVKKSAKLSTKKDTKITVKKETVVLKEGRLSPNTMHNKKGNLFGTRKSQSRERGL